jgi:hypothetical protein
MPFLMGKMADQTEQFWQIHPRKPGIYTGDSGTKWGDFMMCAFDPPRTLITYRVLDGLRQLRGQVLTETEFPVAEVKSKKLREIPPPRYFAPQWAPGIEMDWRASGVERDNSGNPIIVPGNVPPRIAKLSTWNGSDIFSWVNWDATHLTMLCTERVVELAEKVKWTNCEFKPLLTVP